MDDSPKLISAISKKEALQKGKTVAAPAAPPFQMVPKFHSDITRHRKSPYSIVFGLREISRH